MLTFQYKLKKRTKKIFRFRFSYNNCTKILEGKADGCEYSKGKYYAIVRIKGETYEYWTQKRFVYSSVYSKHKLRWVWLQLLAKGFKETKSWG